MSREQQTERVWAGPVLAAALLVVPLLALESADLDGAWPTILAVADWVIWATFFGEAVALLRVVPDRRAWVRKHPLEVAIVMLTFPLLTALFPAFKALRLLRLLRLMRVARLARRAFSMDGLRYASLLAAMTAIVGAQAFAQIEDKPYLDSIYWAVTTMTTVGYGDVLAESNAGKLLAMVVMLVGIGFVAVLTGAIAERFIAADVQEGDGAVAAVEADVMAELRKITERLDSIESLVRADGPA